MTADIILVLVLAGGFMLGFFRGLVRQALVVGAWFVLSWPPPTSAYRSASGWPRRRRASVSALDESTVARLIGGPVVRPLGIIIGPLLPPPGRSVMV